MNDLNAATKNLYTAFGSVPKPEKLAGEAYELSEHDKQFLLREPVRTLTATHFRDYLFLLSPAEHWGSCRELAYFLPRLLELLAAGELSDFDGSRVVNAVRKCLLQDSWARKQQEAVQRFLDEFEATS